MIIKKENLIIELDENIAELEKEIEQLEQLKEKIINSPVFKLLDGKTQIIDDKTRRNVRSRQKHSINVANISKTIIGRIYDLCATESISATNLFKLNKKRAELYAEITGLSHDLGHTPFGHTGEDVVNKFFQSITDKKTIEKIIEHRKKYFGEEYEEKQGHVEGFEGKLSFEHNEQSATEFYKIVDNEEFSRVDRKKIIDGILAHSISRVPELPEDLIAQIIRQTDKIEYINNDLEEFKMLLKESPGAEEMVNLHNSTLEQRIENSIQSMVREAIETGRIDDNNEALSKLKNLRQKHKNIIYFLDKDGKRNLLKGDNKERQQAIYEKIIKFYYQNPERIPIKSRALTNPINTSNSKEATISFDKRDTNDETLPELVIRYVNTFTNKKCINKYYSLVKQRILKGKGYGIEPVTPEEIEKRKMGQIQLQIEQIKKEEMGKGNKDVTYEHYIHMLEMKYQGLLEELTPEGIEIMQNSKKRHEKENEEDKVLWEMLRQADKKRLENAMELIGKDTLSNIPKRIEMKEEQNEDDIVI